MADTDWHKARFTKRTGAIKKTCDICGKDFYLPKSKTQNNIRCSSECNAKYRALRKEERRRVCLSCGSTFYPRWVQINAGAGKYCSQKCNGAAHSGENSPSFGYRLTQEQRQKWRETRDKNESWLYGEKNPRWRGGPEASMRRFVESGKARVNCQNRRARKRENGGKLSADLKDRLFKLQRGKCACCGKPLGDRYHLDHIIPIALGGPNEDWNIQLLKASCNARKGCKDPIEFMQQQGFLI